MRIDPKTLTLDSMDRDAIRRGLELLAAQSARTIARKRSSPHAWQDRVKRELDTLESRAARVADLLATFAD